MDTHNNEATRLWKVFRTAHQMMHDRVRKRANVKKKKKKKRMHKIDLLIKKKIGLLGLSTRT
jgi:hypothetical protein